MSRRHDLRRLRKHQSYTALELAAVLKVNILTVRRWCMEGLTPIERRRPFLFLGEHVAIWLAARVKPHRSLAPGELLCVRCNAPRLPRDLELSLIPRGPTTMDFYGYCEVCDLPSFRRVRIAEIEQKSGPCRITYEDAEVTVRRTSNSPQTELAGELAS